MGAQINRNGEGMENVLEICGLKKSFCRNGALQTVLQDVNIRVEKGRFVSLVGKSGSGKSTLLYIINGLLKADEGIITVCGSRLNDMNEHERAVMRRSKIGFVFQFYNLIKNLNAYDNICLPVIMNDGLLRDYKQQLDEITERLNIGDCLKKFPSEMSGGEQQRVAIARALITSPHIILADEPTGNLDPENAEAIMSVFRDIVGTGTTVLQVTHSNEMAVRADEVYLLTEGILKKKG